jgi:hypothetical protein
MDKKIAARSSLLLQGQALSKHIVLWLTLLAIFCG